MAATVQPAETAVAAPDPMGGLATVFSNDLRAAAAFRIGLALSLITDLWRRSHWLIAYHVDAGVPPRKALLDAFAPKWSWSLHMLSGAWPPEAALFFIAGACALGMHDPHHHGHPKASPLALYARGAPHLEAEAEAIASARPPPPLPPLELLSTSVPGVRAHPRAEAPRPRRLRLPRRPRRHRPSHHRAPPMPPSSLAPAHSERSDPATKSTARMLAVATAPALADTERMSGVARLDAGEPGHPPTLSVVVPCHDEELVLGETHARLTRACRSLGVRYELIYIDDGSRDATRACIEQLRRDDPCACLIGLSRNFGHQTAVTAGMQHARGQAVVLIDADLQDPPELIPEMFRLWQGGADVVYAVRRARRGESLFKRATAALFYRLLNLASNVPIPADTGDFRLMDRRVVDAVSAMPERDRFLRGMVAWVGFRQQAISYERDPRRAGSSKYPLSRMLALALDATLSFSARPLRFATYMGFLASGMALAGIIYALVVRLCTTSWVSGWAFLAICVLFMGGVQLACIGIMGEYLGRVYAEVKRRPLYLVDRLLGVAGGAGSGAGADSRAERSQE